WALGVRGWAALGVRPWAALGVRPWALGLEAVFAAESALNAQRSTLNAPSAQRLMPNAQGLTPDARIVQVPAALDRDGDRVDDRLERVYRERGQAGWQAAGGPAAADLLICLDHPPTSADLAGYRARGATDLQAWGDLEYAVRARFPAALLPPAAL